MIGFCMMGAGCRHGTALLRSVLGRPDATQGIQRHHLVFMVRGTWVSSFSTSHRLIWRRQQVRRWSSGNERKGPSNGAGDDAMKRMNSGLRALTERFQGASVSSGTNLSPNERSMAAKLVRQRAAEAFHAWRRKHTVFLIVSGVILGAGLMGAGLYLYLDYYPSAVEKFVVEKTTRAFASALSFESRKKIYFGLPEPNVPALDTMILRVLNEQAEKNSAEDVMRKWSEIVCDAFAQIERKWILQAKSAMRERLLEEARQFETLEKRVEAIHELYPASVERNILVAEEFDKHLAETKEFIPSALLEGNRPQDPEEACEITNKMLIQAIAFYPGSLKTLIELLNVDDDNVMVEKIQRHMSRMVRRRSLNRRVEEMEKAIGVIDASTYRKANDSEEEETDRKLLGGMSALEARAMYQVRKMFKRLSPQMQMHVLNTSLNTTIKSLRSLPRIGGVEPYELYKRAIDDGLLGPLRRDARITEDMLAEARRIYLAMPSQVQARVLLTALQHRGSNLDYVNTLSETERETVQAELVRDLLSSGGVVAVKLAQMLAEHPKVPKGYRMMLGSLREKNETMPLAMFWWNVPQAVRGKIKALGPCLGTGSVKQVHAAKFAGPYEGVFAVAALRAHVEDEALSSISALETSEEVGAVATRLGRLVFREFNLFEEGEVLAEFAKTPIGTHPLFRVVRVLHHSPRCLVEEIAHGRSVAAVLDFPENEAELQETKEVLTEYHRAVFKAFINDGLVHSDIHLGNAVKTENGFVLFDVGQFERIGLPDTKALLWTLGAIATPENRVTLRSVAIAHLASTASLKEEPTMDFSLAATIDSDGDDANTKKAASEPNLKPGEQSNETAARRRLQRAITRAGQSQALLREKLGMAFDEAIRPDAFGNVPEQRVAYMLFLRAAEKHGVEMPKGSFAVAKMVDGMLSQQQQYDLFPVSEDSIEAFLRAHMTWGETADILARKAFKSKT